MYGERDAGSSILGQEVELVDDTSIVPKSSHRWQVGVIAKRTSGWNMLDLGWNLEIGVMVVSTATSGDWLEPLLLRIESMSHCHEFWAIVGSGITGT